MGANLVYKHVHTYPYDTKIMIFIPTVYIQRQYYWQCRIMLTSILCMEYIFLHFLLIP